MLGDRIRQLRISHNFTQDDLAQKLKISKSTVGMYEQNRRSPDLDTLIILATLFHVSTDYLLGLTQNYITTSSDSQGILSANDNKLLEYYHKVNGVFELSVEDKKYLTNFFPYATVLCSEEKELLSYYNELCLKDKRWIMGQMIDLLKKSEAMSSEIPKAQ